MSIAPFSASPNPPIAFGADRVNRLADDIARLAGEENATFLVADPGLGGLIERVTGILRKGGIRPVIFTDIRSDPLSRQIDAAATVARSIGARVVVALGGGSAMDSAKLAAASAGADQPCEHYSLAKNPLPNPSARIICLPTTSGTGSEATRVSVYTNGLAEKVWAWGDSLRPHLSILDPTLVTGLPAHLTAATGIDALVHAIEAMTIRRANVLNDANSLQAIRLVCRHLPVALAEPRNLEARGAMQIAACLAGLAIDNSGTGIAHAFGHALGAIGHIHHGRAVGLSLRACLAWNAEAAPERHAEVAIAMGVPGDGRDTGTIAADLAPAFDRFLRKVGLKISLEGDGLTEADSERLAQTTMAPENKAMRDSNIREITPADASRFALAILSAA